MIWWLQLIIVWLSIDIVIIATGWYAVTTIKPNFPKWWKRVIADVEPTCSIELATMETFVPHLGNKSNSVQALDFTDPF